MKKIGTLGYIILGLITTSAFAQSAPAPTTAAPLSENATANPGKAKGKKGDKKHSHHAHKKSKKDKDKSASEQK